MIRTLLILFLPFLMAGCITSGGAVRDLGAKEKEAFQALDKRFTENAEFMRKATSQIGKLGAEYAEKEFSLELALAKAKRLDSMQALWASTREEFAETQRAMLFYHLYEVELAEQKVLDARIRQRHAAAQEVLDGYNKLHTLMQGAAENLEIVLKHLNRPKSTQVSMFTETFLNEVTAFRQKLQNSENPRLQKLAEEVAHYEDLSRKAKKEADRAVDAIISVKGK